MRQLSYPAHPNPRFRVEATRSPRKGEDTSESVPTVARSNGAAIVALITGIIGLVTSVIPLFVLVFPGILDVVAIVFGVKGRRAADAGAPQGGMATAGLMMGVIALIVFVTWWILFAFGASVRER